LLNRINESLEKQFDHNFGIVCLMASSGSPRGNNVIEVGRQARRVEIRKEIDDFLLKFLFSIVEQQ
jgi:hypothetical protein